MWSRARQNGGFVGDKPGELCTVCAHLVLVPAAGADLAQPSKSTSPPFLNMLLAQCSSERNTKMKTEQCDKVAPCCHSQQPLTDQLLHDSKWSDERSRATRSRSLTLVLVPILSGLRLELTQILENSGDAYAESSARTESLTTIPRNIGIPLDGAGRRCNAGSREPIHAKKSHFSRQFSNAYLLTDWRCFATVGCVRAPTPCRAVSTTINCRDMSLGQPHKDRTTVGTSASPLASLPKIRPSASRFHCQSLPFRAGFATAHRMICSDPALAPLSPSITELQ
ncbi:hypothetical protein LIA77_08494 [Sarocladium implicatum]|nr:hypothetical protein LIA77_08494 [Sarocladium implicatum]